LLLLMHLAGIPMPANSQLEFGPQATSTGGFCFQLSGTVTADDFFDGLHKIETPTGPEYRKGARILTYYPEELLILIDAVGTSCLGKRKNGNNIRTKPTIQFMETLRFRIFWKDGAKLKEVHQFEFEGLSSQQSPAMPGTIAIWTYKIRLKDSGIPLTSHLVVVITTDDDRTVARLSAQI
jgi:hypothetical protein